jgi:capsular exopolysaccharide synthesis family protein
VQQNRPSETVGEQKGPDIGRALLHHKFLLLVCSSIGAGLGYLYFTQQPPVYQSTVELLVTTSKSALPEEGVTSRRGDDLITQCVVATSPAVLALAVDDGNLARRPEFGSRETALALISRGISATPAEVRRTRTEVMQISYSGRSPAECLAVTDAVARAYRSFLGSSEQTVSDETAVLITRARKELHEEIKGLEKEYAEFRADKPLLGQGPEKINPHSVRLTQLEQERTNLLLRQSQLRSRIDSVREALAQGGDREALALMIDQLQNSGGDERKAGIMMVAEKLFPLLLERELLMESLGPDHPKVASIEKRIRLTREHLDDLLDRTGATSPRDLLTVYLEALDYEIETIDVQFRELDELFQTETAAARGIEAMLTRDRQMFEEITQKKMLLAAVVKRLDEMSLFQNERIRTDVIAAPGLGIQIPAKRNEYMGFGAAIGLFLAGAIAYLLEASDRSFRTPEDVREELGATVIGHIPVITNTAESVKGLAPVLCTAHVPKSQSSEAFRLVRTALFFGVRAGNLKVIQITSPDQSDGKSTVSSNLAISIAQSGRRTLLIDGDMRRPTVGRTFGVPKDAAGLSEVFSGAVDPPDAVRESSVHNLFVLTSGKRPNNPAELLASDRFDEFLVWARDHYDFVIVDTPPLLAVSDPGAVASRVDGVILAIRLNKRARVKGAEAKDVLDRVGANVLGVVVNGVNAKGEYGYRAGYRYTYSSGYGYRHGYSYYAYGSNDYTEESVSNGKLRSVDRASDGDEPRRVVRNV